MNTRNAKAVICQSGASNRRVVSRALHESIVECQEQGEDSDKDPAVFLILHQLTFLLLGNDIAVGDERLSKRWEEAMKAVEA